MAKAKKEKPNKKELLSRIEELRALEVKTTEEKRELRKLEGQYEESGYNHK